MSNVPKGPKPKTCAAPRAPACPGVVPRAVGAGPTPSTLRSVFAAYRSRIVFTYGLLNLENLVRLAQPWVLGVAINGLIGGSCLGLLLFAAQYLAFILLGAGRRLCDARAFTGIYAELATGLVVRQRGRGVEVSQVATRSALSREVIDFFQRDLPVVFQALYAVAGALVMLALWDWLLVPFCLALLVPVSLLSAWGGRKSLTINTRLNDELEREVDVIRGGRPEDVNGHYCRVAGWRVRLANCQALNFAGMELFVLALLAAALVRCCTTSSPDLGRIFAVFGYLIMFVGSLSSVPMLVQQFSRLRDINRRISARGTTDRPVCSAAAHQAAEAPVGLVPASEGPHWRDSCRRRRRVRSEGPCGPPEDPAEERQDHQRQEHPEQDLDADPDGGRRETPDAENNGQDGEQDEQTEHDKPPLS